MKLKKNLLLRNTLFILITSMLIRIIGLLNRIILTRSLGNQGISLYTIIIPAIMLFMSLGTFSLHTAMTKVAAKNPSKNAIKKGIMLAIITCSGASIILLIIANVLTARWLKQPSTYYPLLLSIPLIYLTAISSVLRGYYNGLQKMHISSIANLLEQVVRILFTILIFYYWNNENIIFLVSIAIIAMSIGEIASIIFTTSKLRKIKSSEAHCPAKELLSIAIPTTSSQLIGSVTFFLEPIIYTYALTKLNFSNNLILTSYSEITAYALPLITLFSFIPITTATVIMPSAAKASFDQVKKYIEKCLFISAVPALLVSILMYVFAHEYSFLLYKTDIGADYVQKYAFFFIVFYFISPLNAIMQATDRSKKLFIISTIIHVLKLILIFTLPFISNHALIISYLITYYLFFISLFVILKKAYHFKIEFQKYFLLLIIATSFFFFSKILKASNFHYLPATLLISILYLAFVYFVFVPKRNNI